MLGNLHQVIVRPLTLIGLLCMAILLVFHETSSFYYCLTLAQLVFVPVVVERISVLKRWQTCSILLGQIAVTTIFFIDASIVILLCVLLYLLSTIAVAWCGVHRFLQRGFTNTAEVMIDIGLVYIAMGGLWFLAFHLQIDTGFSPIITWLTAIHFHYSAFLLCVTVGLIGRLFMTRLYQFCCIVIAVGPMLVALGITFSAIIEIIAVSLYVFAIFYICYFVVKNPLPRWQSVFIRIAFLTLSFTIIWSFLYAYSNVSGNHIVDIPNMLDFHGLLNCLGFGISIVIAWSLQLPATNQQLYTFPVSQIRGKLRATNEAHPGLVDELGDYINKTTIPTQISDFYEQTHRYALTASVQWSTWFKPFAFVYQFISRRIGQLNLPFSNEPAKMDGVIFKVDPTLDGRDNPRVWQRTIAGKPVFNAIYAKHQHAGHTYMNIALPLPFSSMHGILSMTTRNNCLYLTSDADGDAGTYLAVGQVIFMLPLHEYFMIREHEGKLLATHEMTIFGVKFLHIDYGIQRK